MESSILAYAGPIIGGAIIAGISYWLKRTDERIGNHESRLSIIETTLPRIEKQLDRFDRQLDRFEDKLNGR